MAEQDRYERNEVGTAPPRNLPVIPIDVAESQLSEFLNGEPLPPNVWVSGQPETCPACGASTVVWGVVDPKDPLYRPREEIHPLVWHETQWMAESWLCRTCEAGWIEDDSSPEPLTWVRPYWIVR